MTIKKAILQYCINPLFILVFITMSIAIIISASPRNALGADIYIDPTFGGQEMGTFSNPYNSWEDIVSFSVSNDYRQKCGTTYTGTITIKTSGSSENHIIIGAYYDNGGSPVHEDDTPSFGQTCGDASQKPIIQSTLGSDDLIDTTEGTNQYLEINSIQLKNATTGFRVRSNYNTIRYCYLYNLYWGVRVGLALGSENGDYNTIEYNYIDMNDAIDEDRTSFDAIQLNYRAQYNTVRYNHITGYDHGGIFFHGGDNNTIEGNYIYAKDNHEDFCIGWNYNGDSNIVRYNYCKDAGQAIMMMTGNNNEIYSNSLTCNGTVYPAQYQGCVQLSTLSGYSNNNNKIYNNVIYDNDNANNRGISITVTSNTPTSGNEIYNNIIQKVDDYCIKVVDHDDSIGTNYFKNNICYDYPANKYANIEGSIYTTASSFNARDDASNNLDVDPGLENPLNEQFWPDDISDNVVGNGLNLREQIDNIMLNPFMTKLSGSPPVIKTVEVVDKWNIGPFSYIEKTQELKSPQGLKILN